MESFLVNADRLNPIIEALIEKGSIPEKINDQLLKSIGFDNPSDLLVIHIFKELNIVESDNSPAPLFEKLVDKETSRSAIAEGTVHAYSDLINRYPSIYKDSTSDIQQKISEFFGDKKTELIIKYMTNTFKKLVDYAGIMRIEKVVGENSESQLTDEQPEMLEELHQNGSSPSDSQKEESSEELPTNENLHDKNVNGTPTSTAKEVSTENEIDKIIQTELTTAPSTAQKNGHSTEDLSSAMPPPNSGLDKKVQQAYLKKSDLLFKMNRYEELLPSLTEIIKRFDDSNDQTFQEAVNRSVIRRGIILKKLEQTDELMPALDEIIERFESSNNEHYYSAASMAMLDKAELLEDNGEPGTLLELYKKIINRLQEDSTEPTASRVDQIFLNRIDLIYQFGDDNQTLHALDQTIKRFENNGRGDHFMRDALFKKAEILEQLDRDEEALEAYNSFIEKFEEKVNA